ncbi:hypothetical protein NP233_g9421 [Leucocoprinus birnbaumii]|uniref:Endonuclease/exonuclease/phosphatase domain-containing protein n=1 Tax=Leucocoprinus birnbaumii TaxID=56174 RepID=A0AAD5VM38_9AGAR|nr:hypothetical protein NP233_g9421 [Leucocoprinus birnbaumii]
MLAKLSFELSLVNPTSTATITKGRGSNQGICRFTASYRYLDDPLFEVIGGKEGVILPNKSLSLLVLDRDSKAKVIVAGDFNEYSQTRSVFAPLVKRLTEFDELVDIPLVERYSYVFDQNSEQLNHAFVSPTIAKHKNQAAFEHIHVNNWAPSFDDRISDHDPSVGKVFVCG